MKRLDPGSFEAEYAALKSLADRYERLCNTPTISPTVLVHEAWLRISSGECEFADRSHLLATAATAMRQVLVDYVRRQNRSKRGGGWLRVTMNADEIIAGRQSVDLLALNEALDLLASLDARQARIVELRFFAGLSVEATASAMDLSERTVKREWAMARAWLQMQLESSPG
jgi:RNA polymerase sigma factor (TIGR02999 family)